MPIVPDLTPSAGSVRAICYDAAVSEVYASAGVLYHPDSGKVLLHHRDGNARHYANVWAEFGGVSEAEDGGDPLVTWQREMHEELGISLATEQIVPLHRYVSPYTGRMRHIFYAVWPSLGDDFVLGEGDGYAWYTFDEALALPDILDLARDDLLVLRVLVESPDCLPLC